MFVRRWFDWTWFGSRVLLSLLTILFEPYFHNIQKSLRCQFTLHAVLDMYQFWLFVSIFFYYYKLRFFLFDIAVPIEIIHTHTKFNCIEAKEGDGDWMIKVNENLARFHFKETRCFFRSVIQFLARFYSHFTAQISCRAFSTFNGFGIHITIHGNIRQGSSWTDTNTFQFKQ